MLLHCDAYFYQYFNVMYSLLDDVYLTYYCLLDDVFTVCIEYCAFRCAATDNDVTQALHRASQRSLLLRYEKGTHVVICSTSAKNEPIGSLFIYQQKRTSKEVAAISAFE